MICKANMRRTVGRARQGAFLCLALVFVGAVFTFTGCMSEVVQDGRGTTTRYYQPMLGPEIMRMLFGWPVGPAEHGQPAQ